MRMWILLWCVKTPKTYAGIGIWLERCSRDIKIITRGQGSERIVRHAFELARREGY